MDRAVQRGRQCRSRADPLTSERAAAPPPNWLHTPEIKAWPAKRPRVHIQCTPNGSSWINQVERRFGLLTDQLIRRDVHISAKELEDEIRTLPATDLIATRSPPR
jgi:hypothetical protein